MEPNINIVNGQRIDREKHERAKELRKNQTAAEKILWEKLRNNQLRGMHFRRQQVIQGFIADFFCASAKLVVEVDGSSHDGCEVYDRDRDRALHNLGLRVLRVRNGEVLNSIDEVLEKILDRCEGK